jgi:hypothetical protein
VVTCQSCDAIIDLRSPKFEVLGQARRDQRPRGLLCLGMTAERDGKRWEIIGLLVFEGSDGEETWTWDEWLLMSEDGRYAWIGHDEGKYSWQTLLTPTDPPMIETRVIPLTRSPSTKSRIERLSSEPPHTSQRRAGTVRPARPDGSMSL